MADIINTYIARRHFERAKKFSDLMLSLFSYMALLAVSMSIADNTDVNQALFYSDIMSSEVQLTTGKFACDSLKET